MTVSNDIETLVRDAWTAGQERMRVRIVALLLGGDVSSSLLSKILDVEADPFPERASDLPSPQFPNSAAR